MQARSIRLTAALAALTVLALTSGCMTVEQHVYVQPDGAADLGFAMRLPPPLGPMLSGMMEGQMPDAEDLPEGMDLKVAQEGLDTVISGMMPADQLPDGVKLYEIERDTRLLSTTYHLTLDPNKLRELQGALNVRADTSPEVLFTQFGGGMPNVEGGDLGGMLEGLGGLLGGGEGMPQIPGLDLEGMLTQVEMATVIHMPGRILETNGEQVDESTVKWALDVEALMGEAKLDPMTVSAEGAVPGIMENLAERLRTFHGVDIDAEQLGDIVMRGVLPNPEVPAEEQGEVPLDTHLYGELVALVVGLDETVGSESTPDVLEALGLLGDEVSLARATKASKRVGRLADQESLTDMGVDDIAGLLSGD